MEKDLRGAEAALELSLHPKDGMGGAEGKCILVVVVCFLFSFKPA